MGKTSLCNAGGVGLIPGQGAKIPHASWPKNQNIKQRQDYNKFNKDFKMVHIKKEKKGTLGLYSAKQGLKHQQLLLLHLLLFSRSVVSSSLPPHGL